MSKVSLILLALICQFYYKSCDALIEGGPGPVSSEEIDPVAVEEPGCPRIAHLPEIELKTMIGDWRLPYMSEHWVRFMAKSMHGKNMKKSSLTKACQRVHVKPMPEGQSFNNASVWIQTKCPRTGAEINLGCEPTDDQTSKLFCTDMRGRTKDLDSHVIVVDTDHKTYALVVRCFPRNGMNWAIFSKVKELDHNLVKELLAQVEDMGFKLKNIIEIPLEKCN
jgi:hypothetical protein